MYNDVLELAFNAIKNAYAPYSKYHVGSCVKCKDGKYFIGANIENASYGATCCAERNAIFSCYSNGYRKQDIESITIVSDGKFLAAPCGICRQVLSELIEQETPIILSNKLETKVTSISKLLPMQFGQKDVI